MTSPRSLAARTYDALVEAVAAGEQPKLILFYGHAPRDDGSIGRGCLSQWWPCEFAVDGVTYASAEHWMMARKAELFGDDEALADVLAAPHPGAAKKIGRRVRGFDNTIWHRHRFDIVVAGNVAKFAQSDELGDYLRGTAGRVLVEASPRDRIWGIGLSANNEAAQDPRQWRGQNLLGFALMEARSQLAAAVCQDR